MPSHHMVCLPTIHHPMWRTLPVRMSITPLPYSLKVDNLKLIMHMSVNPWGRRMRYPTSCGCLYKHNICWSWPTGQVAGGHTQQLFVQTQRLLILTHGLGGRRTYPMVVRTNTTSADPDPRVRWQVDIPSGFPYKHNIYWSWPTGQVASGHTQPLSVQTQHLLILTLGSSGR